MKNEQFDYLYASLKASSEHSTAERAAAEAARVAESRASAAVLRARVGFLERVVSDQARRLGDKPSSKADKAVKSGSAAPKHGAFLTAAGRRAAAHRAGSRPHARGANGGASGGGNGVGRDGAAVASGEGRGSELAFKSAAASASSGNISSGGSGQCAAVSLLLLDDELLRCCMAFGGARDLAGLAAASGPALCALAREEPLWRNLFGHVFGATAEADAASASAHEDSKPAGSPGVRRCGGPRRDLLGTGAWFRRFAVRAQAERRWRCGAAQSVVLRGHTASGGFGAAATVTCAYDRATPDCLCFLSFYPFFSSFYPFFFFPLSLSLSAAHLSSDRVSMSKNDVYFECPLLF